MRPYQEIPSLEEMEITETPSLKEIAEDTPVEEESKSLLLDAMIRKAEKKEKKKQERERKRQAKGKKKERLAKKKKEADKAAARRKCPYTGKKAWKHSLLALRRQLNSGGGTAKRPLPVPPGWKPPPVCQVCGKRHN